MTAKHGMSIQQIINQILSFKQDVCEMLESDLERPLSSWRKDRDTLKGLVETAKTVAEKSIDGAEKMTLLILIDHSIYTLEEIIDKIKKQKGSDDTEEEEYSKDPIVEIICDVEPEGDELTNIEMRAEGHDVASVKSTPINLIQVQRIFNRNKNGHSYRTFLYLEHNKEMHQVTNNELKRKNYRGDIYGFQKFLCDKGHMVGAVPVVNMPDMVRR